MADGTNDNQQERIGLHQAVANAGGEVVTPADKPDTTAQEPEQSAADKPDPAPEQSAPPTPPPAEKPNVDDISDEDFDALVQKRLGKSVKDLTPVAEKTKEQLEAEAEKRRSDALAWAIETGKAKKSDYDNAIIGRQKSDKQIALQIFTDSLVAEDSAITPEEAEEIFNDTYHQGDPESRLFKLGEKEIKKIADAYRKENFGFLDTIESEYDAFSKTHSEYKAYKGQIKELAATLPTEITHEFEYDGPNGKQKFSYAFPVDEKVTAKILADYSSENEFSVRSTIGNGKMDKAAIAKEMLYHLKARTFDSVLADVAKKGWEDGKQFTEARLKNAMPKAQAELSNGRPNTNFNSAKPLPRPGLAQAAANSN